MDQVPLEAITQYACEDVDFTLRAHDLFAPRLKKEGLEKLYREVELPLVHGAGGHGAQGHLRGREAARRACPRRRGTNWKNSRRRYSRKPGEEFNIGSPLQLGKILFEKMQVQKIAGTRVKKTKTGYATDVDVLESLKGVPIADLVLDFRQLSKLKNTYLDVLPEMVHPQGRSDPYFLQPGGRGHGPLILERPEPPEHPHPVRVRPPDPGRLRAGGFQACPHLGRLFPD